MNKTNLFSIAGLTLISANLFAGTMGAVENDFRSVYLRADLGYNFFNNPRAETSSATNSPVAALNPQISDRMGYSVGMGYRFLPQFRTDISFTYRPSIGFRFIDSVPEVGTGKLINYSLMANAYFDLNFNIPFTPYLMGGIGISSNRTKKVFFPVVVQHEYGDFTQSATWQVGAGVSYSFTERVLVDLNYQYINLRKFHNTGHFDLNPVPPFAEGLIGTPTSFNNLYSNQIQLGLRCYFS